MSLDILKTESKDDAFSTPRAKSGNNIASSSKSKSGKSSPRPSIPSLKLRKDFEYVERFKDKRAAPVLDADADEVGVLRRYDHTLRTLVKNGVSLDGSCAGRSIIDWSVCYALQGSSYFGEIQNSLNYTVLHAALLLTISLPTFIDPPNFDNSTLERIFNFFMGFSAITHLCCIMAATMYSTALQRPYAEMDVMVARTNTTLFVLSVVFDYLGVCALVAGMMLAAFNRQSNIDGYIQLYAVFLVVWIVYSWAVTMQQGNQVQEERCKLFAQIYLDKETGELSDESLRKIYEPRDVGAMLIHIGLAEYAPNFRAADLTVTDCLSMNDNNLYEIGVQTLKHRMAILTELARLRKLLI